MDNEDRWPKNNPIDIDGEWEDKNAISYPISLYGHRYLLWHFSKAGKLIRPHKHEFEHSTVVMRGTIVSGGDKENRSGVHITAPDVLIFEAGVEHYVRAITDGAIILHVYPDGVNTDDVS